MMMMMIASDIINLNSKKKMFKCFLILEKSNMMMMIVAICLNLCHFLLFFKFIPFEFRFLYIRKTKKNII